MCPICISAAAMAAMAGTGSAGGLAALVAVKLHLKRSPGKRLAIRGVSPKAKLQPHEAGGVK
jgi:hypothetical protein